MEIKKNIYLKIFHLRNESVVTRGLVMGELVNEKGDNEVVYLLQHFSRGSDSIVIEDFGPGFSAGIYYEEGVDYMMRESAPKGQLILVPIMSEEYIK